jgi:hypothetical protein
MRLVELLRPPSFSKANTSARCDQLPDFKLIPALSVYPCPEVDAGEGKGTWP